MVPVITATGTIPTTTADVPTTADVAGGATAIECAVGGKDLIGSPWRTSGPATLAHALEPLPCSRLSVVMSALPPKADIRRLSSAKPSVDRKPSGPKHPNTGGQWLWRQKCVKGHGARRDAED